MKKDPGLEARLKQADQIEDREKRNLTISVIMKNNYILELEHRLGITNVLQDKSKAKLLWEFILGLKNGWLRSRYE